MYIHPNKELWTGRIDSESDLSSFRFHQKVQVKKMKQLIDMPANKTFALIGFECDEGVKRNKGRIGAAKAPLEVKSALSKLPWIYSEQTDVIDVGNIACEGEQLEKAQEELGKAVSYVLQQQITPIIIGGGHETLYGHYLGVRETIGTEKSLGIINIDAHFDMRPYDQQTSSGTMFKQILDRDPHCGYLCVGIQTFGNTKSLFETAHQYGCTYIKEENLTYDKMDETFSRIDDFISRHDHILLTLCMDVISASAAPGVSAPSPFGLDPKVVRALLQHIISHPTTLSFDISEVNPLLDQDRKTITLAAYFLAEVIAHFHHESKTMNGGKE